MAESNTSTYSHFTKLNSRSNKIISIFYYSKNKNQPHVHFESILSTVKTYFPFDTVLNPPFHTPEKKSINKEKKKFIHAVFIVQI